MSSDYEARYGNEEEIKKEREKEREAAKRGEAAIKRLLSMPIYAIGVLALLSGFFHSDPDRTTHGLLLLILGTLIIKR